jgi:hypothetical protein
MKGDRGDVWIRMYATLSTKKHCPISIISSHPPISLSYTSGAATHTPDFKSGFGVLRVDWYSIAADTTERIQ